MARAASGTTRPRRADGPTRRPASRRTTRPRPTPAQRRRRATRARRWRIALISTGSALAVGAVTAVIVIVGLAMQAFGDLADGIDDLGTAIAAPARPATHFGEEQIGNAATIVTAACDLGLGVRDQTIGVMTAMGESSLRNIDYGDWETSGVTNPDGSRTTSIGLFQQQDGWGTREERLDPYTAATLFYRAMLRKVPDPDRQALEPTVVAHRTQINRDPGHYAKYWEGAVRIVSDLRAQGIGCGE